MPEPIVTIALTAAEWEEVLHAVEADRNEAQALYLTLESARQKIAWEIDPR